MTKNKQKKLAFLQVVQTLEVRGLQKAGQKDATYINELLEESNILKHEIDLVNGGDMGKKNYFTFKPSIKQASEKTSMAWNYFENI